MPKTTRVLRTELPLDVWDRFSAEAAEKGTTKAQLLRALIVARDERRQGSK